MYMRWRPLSGLRVLCGTVPCDHPVNRTGKFGSRAASHVARWDSRSRLGNRDCRGARRKMQRNGRSVSNNALGAH